MGLVVFLVMRTGMVVVIGIGKQALVIGMAMDMATIVVMAMVG